MIEIQTKRNGRKCFKHQGFHLWFLFIFNILTVCLCLCFVFIIYLCLCTFERKIFVAYAILQKWSLLLQFVLSVRLFPYSFVSAVKRYFFIILKLGEGHKIGASFVSWSDLCRKIFSCLLKSLQYTFQTQISIRINTVIENITWKRYILYTYLPFCIIFQLKFIQNVPTLKEPRDWNCFDHIVSHYNFLLILNAY